MDESGGIQNIPNAVVIKDYLAYFCHDSKYGERSDWPSGTAIMYYKLRIEYDHVTNTMQPFPLDNSTWHRIENVRNVHVEKIMLSEVLSEMRKRNGKLKCVILDIALSYSPCNDKQHICAMKLVSFKRFVETNLGAEVIMSIKIANFYKLYKTDNVTGLCFLINSGVHLSVFSGHEDWIQFYDDVTAGNNLGNNQAIPNYTCKRQQREEVDVMILQRLKNIAPYFQETGMIPPDFEKLYFFSSLPARFTQAEVRLLTAEYYRKEMENIRIF